MEDAWTYDAPPEGETRFAALSGRPYRRTVRCCGLCEHHTSDPGFDPALMYGGGYMDDTYREGGIAAAFARIVGLPAGRSDNVGRVERVVEFTGRTGTALDVGSGLCVFLHGLAAHGWDCTALDPDPAAAAHARDVVGVSAVEGDFMEAEGIGRFDLVSLNKVIEHVADPVAMLARAAAHLASGGSVYCEVPDAPAAAAEGPGREEFFIEHLHAFSPASLAMAAARAGLSPMRMERLHEPSGKWTIAAFLEVAP
jgi:SAM-dependent methyltransferase